MVGRRLEWREDKVWDSDGKFVTDIVRGEYIWTELPEGRREMQNIWTGERWILAEDDAWLGGPYYRRGDCAYSFRNLELKIELSAKAIIRRLWMSMLGERPVYSDHVHMLRDATNDAALFVTDIYWPCDAGFAIRVGRKLWFSDGVREGLPLGEIGPKEYVEFLRVSETEYSLRVGYRRTGYRYYLLDAANWTCRKV